MTHVTLAGLDIDVDLEETRAAYAASRCLDPTCCNACATFLLAVKDHQLPNALLHLLGEMGIDPSRPVEAWGAPDAGALQVWWPFVEAPRSIATRDRPISLGQGQTIAITEHYPHPSWGVRPDRSVPAVEFTWSSDVVRELERRARESVRT